MAEAKLTPEQATQNTDVASQKDVDKLNNITYGIVIVLFIALAATFGTIATLVISHFDTSQATYQSLRDQVQEQNIKIDILISEIKTQKSQ